MSFGTLTQVASDELHGLAGTDLIWRKVIDATRFHKENRLWFSERKFQFTLTIGRSEYGIGDGYGLPADLVEIVSRRLYLWLNGSETNRQQVDRATPEEFDLSSGSDISNGDPTIWQFDAQRLQLWPAPAAEHVLTGRYVTDIGVPYYKYDSASTAYQYFTPQGLTLTGDYENDWYRQDGAAAMVQNRALYLIFRSLNDPRAEDYLTLWLEDKARLEEETDARVSSGLGLVSRILD